MMTVMMMMMVMMVLVMMMLMMMMMMMMMMMIMMMVLAVFLSVALMRGSSSIASSFRMLNRPVVMVTIGFVAVSFFAFRIQSRLTAHAFAVHRFGVEMAADSVA